MRPSPNLYEQQQRNRRNTALLMASFILFFSLLGLSFDLFYFASDPVSVLAENQFTEPHMTFPFATVAAVLLSCAMSWWGLQHGARAMLSSAGAFPLPEEDPRYRTLINVVDEMAIASGLPRPKIYIVPDPDPNAFATGKDPEHSYIVVTEGLLQTLNREELQGVISHEMSHIRNLDIRLMTMVAALLGATLLISDWATRAMRHGRGSVTLRSGGKSGKGMSGIFILILWLAAILLAPLISQLLAMAVSRQREFLADASGAELTRNPLGLAKALTKIDSVVTPTRSIKKSSAHLCIIDPLGRPANSREGKLANLLATHPPLSKRIALLELMAYKLPLSQSRL